MSSTPQPQQPADSGFYDSYSAFARTLRTWLVAYGVGGPALFLTHSELANRVLASGKARTLVTCFLVGVACQVVGALLYKTAMWYLFLGENRETLRKKWRYKIADWLSEAFWLDFTLDLASILFFGWGSYLLMSVLAKPAVTP